MENKKTLKKWIIQIAIAVFVSIIAAYIIARRYNAYYAFLRLITPKTASKDNDEIIKQLHPVMAYKAAKFIKERESKGHSIILTSGFRSWQKQEDLYNSGQTTAKAGRSMHNYGLAIDLNEDGILKMATPKQTWIDSGIVADAEKYGFRWGGNFSNFYDPVHFDLKTKYDINQLQAMYLDGEVVNKIYVKIW